MFCLEVVSKYHLHMSISPGFISFQNFTSVENSVFQTLLLKSPCAACHSATLVDGEGGQGHGQDQGVGTGEVGNGIGAKVGVGARFLIGKEREEGRVGVDQGTLKNLGMGRQNQKGSLWIIKICIL